jgi:dTDP-4-amino-4,6-dideoxygalactose transaminase
MESKYKYNEWPLGRLPKELERPELDLIKSMGYEWSDPRDVIDMFEKKVAEYSGSKYAVVLDCCSNGIFLCMKYLQSIGELKSEDIIKIPNQTYVSVPMQILHAGQKFELEELEWSGIYQLKGTRIWDSAGRFTESMFVGGNSLQVLSFQIKKIIPIGRGGMILTDDEESYNWLKLACYDGRDLTTPYTSDEHIKVLGYHMYMTPEDAARGIILMDNRPDSNVDCQNNTMYPPLNNMLSNINLTKK